MRSACARVARDAQATDPAMSPHAPSHADRPIVRRRPSADRRLWRPERASPPDPWTLRVNPAAPDPTQL